MSFETCVKCLLGSLTISAHNSIKICWVFSSCQMLTELFIYIISFCFCRSLWAYFSQLTNKKLLSGEIKWLDQKKWKSKLKSRWADPMSRAGLYGLLVGKPEARADVVETGMPQIAVEKSKQRQHFGYTYMIRNRKHVHWWSLWNITEAQHRDAIQCWWILRRA